MHADKEPEPLNLGVPEPFQFPQSQCHPSPCTGIALGTRLATWRQHFDDELQLRQNHRKNQEVRPLLVSILCPYSANCMHMHDSLGARQHSCDSNF